ncbi:hypothetical protein K9M41_03485 [Candidatus Gracilibacteria bacterium]|nr:hypothetical protein [Candidatus Gracilibacteria bacterium]
MKLIIFTKTISKKEKITETERSIILKACRKNILTPIKGKNLPAESALVKLYVTTIRGDRRIVILHDRKQDIGYFLFFRSKNDAIGKNISIKSKKFKESLSKYLTLLITDTKKKQFEKVEL